MTEVERTSDGHFVVIAGRRWRATDPSIPEPLASELRGALMSARRAVGVALRADADATSARAAVHDAKIALGERGQPWWESPTEEFRRARVAATTRTLLVHRAPRTACPSDIARIVGGARWRTLMPIVRQVAEELAEAGTLVVTQRGEQVQPPWRGPVRLLLQQASTSCMAQESDR